ncbi:hypothetical protein F5Y00DRAFT_256179 [Daldinia vernicosa]|uniref:uncharacterized protein n=1 Tax=Daldinia vernicosa TaxID=114800 RepID=UPI0020087353|nr:uncharacterized protein F5Y00DRAFT_256179 [Daldinia vernicosa]KAI0844230.1 hypothetical protein F5Y00DRAFT_256179 [Daldinia vernicosa]
MSTIPIEKVLIPRYGEQRVAQASMPDVEAWVVNSKLDKGIPFKLWMKPEMHKKLQAWYPNLPNAEDITHSGGFLRGRPMLETAITIETCGGDNRPKKLYRVVHTRQPFEGIKARGYGTVEINPLHFQVLVQKHLNWHCSSPSPFLSVTDNLDKLTVIAAVCEARGFTGIEVLEIDPAHSSWDHRHQRLWNTKYLVDKFDTQILQRRMFLHHEFLVENMIPPESILGRHPWKSLRRTLDPSKFWLNLMKKKVKHVSRLKRRREGEGGEKEKTTSNQTIHEKADKRALTDGPKTERIGEEAAVMIKRRKVIDFKLRL